jgi:hypothetical protein
MQYDTSPSHGVDQVVDCGLWNVVPLLFNGCAKLLYSDGNWNKPSFESIQSIPNMLNACPYHNPTATMGHSVHISKPFTHTTVETGIQLPVAIEAFAR